MIVLDTHAWVWWLASPARLGKKAGRAVEKADRIGVAAISVWEVAAKAERGKLVFDRPYDMWIDEALTADPRIELLALLPRIAVDAVRLRWDHREPAARLIVATATAHDAVLVTADDVIRESGLVGCVWD